MPRSASPTRRAPPPSPARLSLALALALGLPASAAQAVETRWGDFDVSLDTSLSLGAAWRVESPDDRLIGKAEFDPLLSLRIRELLARDPAAAQALQVAARGAFSANRDDGNRRFASGDPISTAFRITSEAQLRWDSGGAFLRASYFHDAENQGRRAPSREADRLIGERARLLDAFLYQSFDAGDQVSGSLRVGRQVINWGESSFLRGGINAINAFDLAALRVAGSEVKEALLPLDALWASLSWGDHWSLEATWLLEFEEVEPEPAGSYFSSNDFGTPGGRYVMLGFGTVPSPVIDPGLYAATCLGAAARPQASDRFADYASRFGEATAAGLIAAGCGASFPRAETRSASDHGQFGLAARYFSDDRFSTEWGAYYLRHHSRLPVLSGRAVTSAALSSGRYFLEYPEDIDLFGLSWNSALPGGWAMQGEISHRRNQPLQVDDVELLFAGLSPLNAGLPPPLRFNSQLGSFGFGEEIRGWRRHRVSQLQVTLSKLFGPDLLPGADQLAFAIEAGVTRVGGLPDAATLRYEGEGTDTGGGPDILDGALRNPLTQVDGFPDATSWGYRALLRATYNSVGGSPVSLLPRLAFNHDVSGITPGPGGNFLEGRKALTLGVEAVYLDSWSLELAYTRFSGAGTLNQIADRDFASLALKYAF
ncbi:DUF1302 domain-containing protein [Pseudomarimonas salicorniae]|uniref:DUF1302 domain-containing protein n=1 Tax=Pseudomarimonas salicorniae TaxID=2933270 RepID=A0ABT0GDC7_9GAMM|nr:DUF1302 domain-containing protein [Lysobacter sp. CAU 1642]MCK7592047.1 DUF1302 domain-containing protein [Lysobacter sp. CAU 1642]